MHVYTVIFLIEEPHQNLEIGLADQKQVAKF